MHRITASAIYGRPVGSAGQWATTLLYGANRISSADRLSNSVLLESEAILGRSNTVLGRLEYVQKDAEELVVNGPPFNFAPTQPFDVGQLSLGYIRELIGLRGATIGLGAMGTLNIVPSTLSDVYGSRMPIGSIVFLRLRPAGIGLRGMTKKQPMDSVRHASMPALLVGQPDNRDDDQHDQEHADYASAHPSAHMVH